MFRTEALRQRIELINHLVEFGRQLILIQGPVGFGKTTMLEAIEESAEPGWVFIRFNAGPTLNNESLLQKISVNLDFEPTEQFTEEEICTEIYRRLEILQKSNQTVVIAIDDAHDLPSETHPLLLTLAHNDEAAAELRVILAADSSDSSLLDSLQSNSEQSALIHTVDIPKMDREQTASLLSWWQDQQDSLETVHKPIKFTSPIIDEIHADSEGVPGNILTLARQYRLSGVNTQLRADPVKKYIAIGFVAFLLVLVFSFFSKDAEQPEEQQLNIELPNPVADTEEPPAVEPATTDTNPAMTPTNSESVSQGKLAQSTPPNNLDKKLEMLDDPQEQTPLSSSGGLEDMLSAQLAEGILPGPPPGKEAKSEPSKIIEPTMTTKADSQNKSEPLVPVDLPESQEMDTKESKESSTAVETTITQPDTPTISVKIRSQIDSNKKPVTAKPREPKLPQAPKKLSKDEYSLAALLRESPDGYVLQLFGVRNHDAADKYRKKHGITATSAVVASMHEGSPWYVVIYGQYESRQRATEAIPSISQKLPNVKPWPRPVSSLK